jgi:putative SOS response-associated peptidase YedK
MCGRFTLSVSAARLQKVFPLFEFPEIVPRYNIAPTQEVLAIRQKEHDPPRAAWLRWGLIPHWAKDKKLAATLINARADTAADKPAFRDAFKRRRCLIVADGFYEWRKEGKLKQPFHIRRKDGQPFAFAGLWETWHGEQPPVASCTIVTTDANEAIRHLHERMPVILDAHDYARWLDPAPSDPGILCEMLRPCSPDLITVVAANPFVNNSRNEGAECLVPAS